MFETAQPFFLQFLFPHSRPTLLSRIFTYLQTWEHGTRVIIQARIIQRVSILAEDHPIVEKHHLEEPCTPLDFDKGCQ
jgi:hypothetical protein